MSDFFQELEEDIREERIYLLWRKYGNIVIGIALAIVLATIGHTLWKYYKNSKQESQHASFAQGLDLLQQGNKEEALKEFQTLSKEEGGYGKLAQLYEATLLPNPESLYEEIAKENQRDPALGNLPKLLMAGRSLDEGAPLSSLVPLTAPNNAWAPLSLELLAFADLKKGDESKAAEKYIRMLSEPHISPEEQIRASMMLSQIDIPPALLEKLTENPKEESKP